MADRILTALGLDMSQYADGISDATRRTMLFRDTIGTVDSTLRSLPLGVGSLYSATFGRIVEGLASSREQAREFSRIMRTDVSGSLHGVTEQIVDINNLLAKQREGGPTQRIADFAHNFLHFNQFTKGNSAQQQRADRDVELVQRRLQLESQLVGLSQQQAIAESVTYSRSVQASANAKTELDYRQRLLDAENQINKIEGVERPKWSKDATAAYEEQKRLADDIRFAEIEATKARIHSVTIELDAQKKVADLEYGSLESEKALAEARLAAAKIQTQTALEQRQNVEAGTDVQKAEADAAYDIAQKHEKAELRRLGIAESLLEAQRLQYDFKKEVAKLEVEGNERQQAAAALRNAEAQNANAKLGTLEQQRAAEALLEIAKQRKDAVDLQYQIALKQLELETTTIDLQVRGQTRAANQAKIQAEFETRITEELRKGNDERVKQLEMQRKSALLAEDIREYNLGARGRAAEKLKERHDAQIARIAESRRKHKEQDQYIHDEPGTGIHSAGTRYNSPFINTGGLTTGNLGPKISVKTEKDSARLSKEDQFITDIKTKLDLMVSALGK